MQSNETINSCFSRVSSCPFGSRVDTCPGFERGSTHAASRSEGAVDVCSEETQGRFDQIERVQREEGEGTRCDSPKRQMTSPWGR